ncbi:hypothetical protein D7U70_04690 [Pseudomonas balearica]|nr:hypothetical protein [Stutzerimonas balearica]
MLYWQLRFVRQAFSCWVIFSQLLLAMTWCSVSLFLLLVREGHPGGFTCLEAMCGARAGLSLFAGVGK